MKRKIIKRIVLGLFLVMLFLIMAFLMLEVMGRRSMQGTQEDRVEVTVPESEEVVLEDDGETITYKGEKYTFNENVTAILCMGVDKSEFDEDDTIVGNAGQADLLMLAILDTESGDAELWNISRDAMTDVDIYNVDGEYVRTENMQACLAFAYGDGAHESCKNMVKSVSRLLYGMPIASYAVMDMEAIVPLNDAIGGVEVTIHEGDILPARFKPGTTVLLKGRDVLSYVQSRRTELPNEAIDSNNNRMARQRQYMTNFLHKALQMTKEDVTTPLRLFNIARDERHLITDLTMPRITYLATALAKVDFSENSFRTVPGEVVAGEKYAEFHVDDEALYEMILDAFYVKE